MKRFIVFVLVCLAALLACHSSTDDIEPVPAQYRIIEVPVISLIE